jgi:hypothetical protein
MVSTEILAQRRRWLLIAAALGTLLWQGCELVIALAHASVPVPTLRLVGLAGFLIFIGAVVGLGFWADEAREQAGLEDEMTRHNRLRAFTTGFWAMLAVAGCQFAAGGFVALPGAEAARLVVVAGIVAPLLRFAFLERSA